MYTEYSDSIDLFRLSKKTKFILNKKTQVICFWQIT